MLPHGTVLEIVFWDRRSIRSHRNDTPLCCFTLAESPSRVEHSSGPKTRIDTDQPSMTVARCLRLHIEIIRDAKLFCESDVIRHDGQAFVFALFLDPAIHAKLGIIGFAGCPFQSTEDAIERVILFRDKNNILDIWWQRRSRFLRGDHAIVPENILQSGLQRRQIHFADHAWHILQTKTFIALGAFMFRPSRSQSKPFLRCDIKRALIRRKLATGWEPTRRDPVFDRACGSIDDCDGI